MNNVPSLSTDQVAAFVELARLGSLRRAAEELNITEQGVRNRLLALEQRLKVELYRKQRGMRRSTQLTEQGKRFLPHAVSFLERARDLCEVFGEGHEPPREVHVVASQYLIMYLLIDAVGRFHEKHPQIRVRLSNRTEQEIEEILLQDPSVSIGVAAPYEPSADLVYENLFSMNWSLITPPQHRLSRAKRVRLEDLADESLILFERGSTGRQHVIDAFHSRGLSPIVDMETTNTDIIVRMVEAGLGISIVPLMESGIVTKGRKVTSHDLGRQIRPIQSGLLRRQGETLSRAPQTFVDFVRHIFE